MKTRSIFLWIVTLMIMSIVSFIELLNASANSFMMTILTLSLLIVFIASFTYREVSDEKIIEINNDAVKEFERKQILEAKRNLRKKSSHRMFHRN